jgi:excisionase family DNA binding protein
MSESLYSTADVARLFEINRVTIYRWVQEGVVKAYKVGKHLKIPASEVERLWKEFGFPGASDMNISEASKKIRSRDPVSIQVRGTHKKKLVMAVISDEGDLGFIREIFAEVLLKKNSRLVIYVDTLEAALSIGKEKPDLLLIKMADSNGNDLEFGRKISSTHSDIKVIFMSDSSLRRDDKEGKAVPEDAITIVGRARLHGEIVNALGIRGGD